MTLIIFDAKSICCREHKFIFVSLKSRAIQPYTKHVCAHVGEQEAERETKGQRHRELERRKEQIEKV